MKSIIPKALLEWKEPKPLRKAMEELEQRAHSRWAKPFMLCVITLSLLAIRWMNSLNPDKSPPSWGASVPLAVAGACVFVYAMPLIYRLCPSYVRVFDNGISRVVGNHARMWKFKDIDRCELALFRTGGGVHSVLVIHSRTTRSFVIGVGSDLVPKLIQTLSGLGVRIVLNEPSR